MIRMPEAIQKAWPAARMILSVHDELIFEVAEDQVDELPALARTVMSGVSRLSAPLTVHTGSGHNWAEAH